MGALKRLIAALDRWQRGNRVAGPAYGVVKKFSDDNANLLVVALGWYGFTAIYPLLLVVITIFGFIGEASLGTGIVSTLHTFPVIGQQFNPGHGGSRLHGSIVGLVIGLAGLIYGAQGVTQTAQQAMEQVWNLPQTDRPGFLPRLARSLGGLVVIGGAFVINAPVASIATGGAHTLLLRVPVIAGMLVLNVGLYLAAFRMLTPKRISVRKFLPGAVLGAVAFTLLITVGAGLVEHQLRNSSATYGALASVIGVVTFLLLLAKVSVYAAELNPVLARSLWPRALPTTPPSEADEQVLRDLVHEQRRRGDENIDVDFEEPASAPPRRAQKPPPRVQEAQPRVQEAQPRVQEAQPRVQEAQPRVQEAQPRVQEAQPRVQEAQSQPAPREAYPACPWAESCAALQLQCPCRQARSNFSARAV
ncbi:MAG: YihY/virulence factor BrkB family protein [Acidimicrobiales bacterium]